MRAVVEKAQQSDNHHAVLPIDNELHLVSFAPDVPQPPSAPFSGNPTSPYGPLHQHPPDHPSLVYPVTISLDDESPEGTQRTFPSSPQPSRPYTCRNETSQPADGYGSSDGRSSGGPGTMAPATVTATSLPAFGGGGSGGGQRVCQGSHSIRVDTGAEVELPPVQVILSGDNHQVAIKIADEGGGIAREAESKIWSYLYTTAKPIGEPSNEQDSQVKNMPHAPHTGPFGYLDRSQRNGLRPGSSPDASKPSISPLAGFGCGLPLSRLYAQYLGGSLKVVSMPRWGTDAYLFLSKIGDIQERVPPGWSVPLAWQSAERQRAGGSGLLDVGDIPTQEDQASQHYPPFAL
ncbi:unnamed protein product [Vitrella brassicaformis CCMP3155]|uniref:Protein-serine/threonine kinase n=2 Tax=Vitrella brassicaformis TaxID=1169539 RepID=A0A0G4H2Z6_VITBC|nr:unnamed protein product [Vitrella brassicaformis CCMP3155]|eukprot:CEM37805.1 unnamed protein product [Vitrella brassicaformis CCMP3155]